MIYFDYNATTPIFPEVKEAMEPLLKERFGNPSCSYPLGREAKDALERAREEVATLIHARPQEIIFTSGGTEANNTVFKGILWALKEKGNHVITTAIEHPSILKPAQFMQKLGFEITFVSPTREGRIEPEKIKRAIRKDTILISVMHANNETGIIQPIAEAAQIAKKYNIIFHTDAAQSLGKIEVNVDALGVDLLTIAGHKLYAPKGIGALYIRENVPFLPLIHGAGQENGKRAGTENVAFIVGLGKACSILKQKLKNKENLKIARLRDKLWEGLKTNFEVIRHGASQYCLPNTIYVSFKKITAQHFLNVLPEICVSPGAACHSQKTTFSHVLKAMGISYEIAKGALRFSLGYFTTEEEIEKALNLMIKRLQN